MYEETEVPFGDKPSETATLLLAAAEDLGLEPFVVRVNEGVFLVPPEVAEKASSDNKPAEKSVAKKAPAKKTAAKASK